MKCKNKLHYVFLQMRNLSSYVQGMYLKETVLNKEPAEGKQMTRRTHLPFSQRTRVAYNFYFVLQGCPSHINHRMKKHNNLFVLLAEI